jgi:hypothetical protein
MMIVSEWILIVTVIVNTTGNYSRPEITQIPVQSMAVCEKVGKLVAEDFVRMGYVRVSFSCLKVVEP